MRDVEMINVNTSVGEQTKLFDIDTFTDQEKRDNRTNFEIDEFGNYVKSRVNGKMVYAKQGKREKPDKETATFIMQYWNTHKKWPTKDDMDVYNKARFNNN